MVEVVSLLIHFRVDLVNSLDLIELFDFKRLAGIGGGRTWSVRLSALACDQVS